MANEIFDIIDKDKDGVLSREEWLATARKIKAFLASLTVSNILIFMESVLR